MPESTAPITLGTYWRLVRRNRNFRRLWAAQVISETGDWFYMVALYAMLLEFTGRAGVLGLAFALQVLPQALTGPVAVCLGAGWTLRLPLVALTAPMPWSREAALALRADQFRVEVPCSMTRSPMRR